jgi:hypothetical protein
MPMSTEDDKGEMFSTDPRTGQRVDAHIHEAILKGVSKPDHAKLMKAARKRGLELGLTPEEVLRHYK